jgi:hypothetical protein
VVIGAVILRQHPALDGPAIRQIKKQVIERQAIAHRRQRRPERRVWKASREGLPGWFVEAEPGVQIAAGNAMALG